MAGKHLNRLKGPFIIHGNGWAWSIQETRKGGFLKRKKIIISDIYPGSSSHLKVVFREVLHSIELDFGNVDFWGVGRPENLEKNVSEQSKEPTTNLTNSWPRVLNQTRATKVRGECNHHKAIPAPQKSVRNTWKNLERVGGAPNLLHTV